MKKSLCITMILVLILMLFASCNVEKPPDDFDENETEETSGSVSSPSTVLPESTTPESSNIPNTGSISTEKTPNNETNPSAEPCYYHTFGEWVVDKETTCTERGSKYAECLKCGYKKTQNLKFIGHEYNIDYECVKCGHTASKGLEFSRVYNNTCSVQGIGTCTDTEIVIPSKTHEGATVVGIESFAFHLCNNITSVVIPYSVTTIGRYAFSNCMSLSNVDFSGGIIEGEAFLNCKNLTSLDLSGVSEIGKYAFSGCSGLKELFIPDSVTNIEAFAFSGCENLESIEVSEDNKVYSSINNCLVKTKAKTLVLGCKNSVIPSDGSVLEIGKGAFSGCSGLTSVDIPQSVYTIGEGAFSNCSGLISVTFQEFSAIELKDGAFNDCVNLEKVVMFEDNIVKMGDYIFYDCIKLTEIMIPNWTDRIGNYMFYNCKSLTSIAIPQYVSFIGECAFENCENLESVVFEKTDGWVRRREAVDVTDPLKNAKELTSAYSQFELTQTN